jgi:four helix bundle protein
MAVAHHNLIAWRRADDLFIDIHRLTHQQFPRHERFELGSQLRRAAYSVPANIVEGSAREHAREKIRFFNIASASLRELGYGLHAARRLGYLDDETLAAYTRTLGFIGAPLQGLIARHRRAAPLDR